MRFSFPFPLPTRALLLGCLGSALCSCGGGGDDVRVYEVIVPAGRPTNHPTPTATPSATAEADGTTELIWDAPAEWTKIDNAHRFDRARYTVKGDDGNEAIATVTAGISGSIPMNVNRWRSQLGLEQAPEEELKAAAQTVNNAASPGVLFVLTSPDGSRRILAAILPVSGDTYYFKLDGPTALVDSLHDDFIKMIEGARVKGSPAPSPSSASTEAASAPELKLATPEGWVAVDTSKATSMRTASYTTANASEVAVLRFRQTENALVQNINIWLQELGLPEYADDATPEFSNSIESSAGLWNVFAATGANNPSLAIRAGMLVDEQTNTLWVVRMKGTNESVTKDVSTFDKLLADAAR